VLGIHPTAAGGWVVRAFLPWPGRYRVVVNTDAPVYGGAGVLVPQVVDSRPGHLHGRDQYLELPLPGLSVLVLKPER
jgi:1,4-alpha-glucan branching enzyme